MVGTASWSDPGFVERWYPAKLPAAERLPWYAQHFELVEVNSSFYAVPDRQLVTRWSLATPAAFVFDVKLHRLLSRHAAAVSSLPPALRQIADGKGNAKAVLNAALEEALLEEMIFSTEPLRVAGKFGSFLLQMSPAFSPRKHRLDELEPLLGRLRSLGVAVELRNRNWLEGEQRERTLEFFQEQSTALTLVDAPDEKHFTILPNEFNELTNPRLAYLRLHGRDARAYLHGRTVAERFHYDYSDEEIEEVAARAKKLARKAERVHVIFNNNALDFAPHAAQRLRVALGQLQTMPPRQAELFR